MQESIGKRIALLRQKNGWTQQSLADRLAMSRVAISHIEMDLTIPSERSIILMAGVFKLLPHALVDGTTYPPAKAERLPSQAAFYTQLELDFVLMKNDLDWLERLTEPGTIRTQSEKLLEMWRAKLDDWSALVVDEHERVILLEMQRALHSLVGKAHQPLT